MKSNFRIEEIPMRKVTKFAVLTLAMLVFTVYGVSQNTPQIIIKPLNLERGVVGPVLTSASWSDYSALSVIPGAGLIPHTATTSVFYLGFTGGQTADISNMVLYT